MTRLDPLFVYMAALTVCQPAQISEVESAIIDLFGKRATALVGDGEIRSIHKLAVSTGLVMSVRHGVYAISKAGRTSVRTGDLWKEIDNRRLFLMKARKKGILSNAK